MAPIGVRLPNELYGYVPIEEMTSLAIKADKLGYHSVWATEEAGRNGLMVLSRLASATDRIRLGSGIVNVYSRSPALLAMSVATLDELSGGRTLLGIGASSRPTIEDWHGVAFDRPLRRIRETMEIVDRALEGAAVEYDGAIYDVDYRRQFRTDRRVPIYNAALGERNRRLTGRFADGWLPIHVPADRIDEYATDVRGAATDAGRDPGSITVAPYVVTCVDDDAELAREIVRKVLAFYVGAMEYYAGVFERYGYETDVGKITEAWSTNRGEAHAYVSDDLLDSVAIAGSPAWGRERLSEYRERGVDVPILALPTLAPAEMRRSTLEALAPG